MKSTIDPSNYQTLLEGQNFPQYRWVRHNYHHNLMIYQPQDDYKTTTRQPPRAAIRLRWTTNTSTGNYTPSCSKLLPSLCAATLYCQRYSFGKFLAKICSIKSCIYVLYYCNENLNIR
ncbi:uncharacterized protein ASCRUDRAFT_79500 [Ascoidea rubescens DSM 1968]|uniref:Uncharacterized protein n=1 Tax=Ascoidea rubescens DSM 1968 TaxID=1344418 RepID=A0A1D2VMN0_9ASCO|nr:hypothetical protein ASCRUDRAFT_79500 [Ascoidea rubescens DSM 1968]ODV62871.1 hypothetical protein ASCRUDRAFT_79500 [Ascoidea rubescens DSM 1968]